MTPPFLSYITFNRLGLIERNLKALFETTDDFEMHIIDNHSTDGAWEYVQSLEDPRIKSRIQFSLNQGPIYSVNFNLSRRKAEQYFITIDNDVNIETKDWISQFMKVFNTFPEAGLLGVQRGAPYPQYMPPVIPKFKDGICYLQLKNGIVGEPMDFVPGCCQCLRPELIKEIGYWSEENHYGDAEMSPRINNYTSFKAGFMTSIKIDMTQEIDCGKCAANKWCKRASNKETCFEIRDRLYKNKDIAKMMEDKYHKTFKELEEGKRTPFSASVFDGKSMEEHIYYKDWAAESFNFYVNNAN